MARTAFKATFFQTILTLVERRLGVTKPLATLLAAGHALVAQDDLANIAIQQVHVVDARAFVAAKAL